MSTLKKNVTYVMKEGHSQHMKNGFMCEDKWGALNGDFKKILDYMAKMSHEEEYWSFSRQDKITLH